MQLAGKPTPLAVAGVQANVSGSKLVDLYAAPLTWGPGQQINSCFGDEVKTKFGIAEQVPEAPIRFQTRTSLTNKWDEAMEGVWIPGQVVELRAQSTGTGGLVRVRVEGGCIF